MALKISGGELKGRVLHFPDAKGLRPTSSRVREAVFSALASTVSIEGLRVADFFAGSGVLGFEALSRGAKRAYFVELNKGLIKAIESNGESLCPDGSFRTVALDIEQWIRKPRELFDCEVDLVFIDPPYELDLKKQIAAKLIFALLASGACSSAVFVVEQSASASDLLQDFQVEGDPKLEVFWSRDYGDTKVSFIRRANALSGV